METDLLSADYIDRILSIGKITAQRWYRERSVPAARIGKSYRITKDGLDRRYEGMLLVHATAEH
jgi:excisionase family DNA binding protein